MLRSRASAALRSVVVSDGGGAAVGLGCHRRGLSRLAESRFFKVSEEVQDAVSTGKPVVALESTIYTHGFPYPDNVALSSLLESVVRAHGGVPATVGILNGVARVGMSTDELVMLASTAEKKSALKVSRRDLAYICGLGMAGRHLHGGTTISGTMLLAHLAGIKIFGTGGLGGVHRGGERSMDISADLTELGRTPVTVISSGCKSFLDIPRTLEYLETEGVCVGTFADGRKGSVDFPAFFTRDSGVKSPKVIKDEAEAAAMIYAQYELPVSSGIHFANPVPLEHSIPKADMDAIIEEALSQAEIEGYHGSDNTPYVLAKIKELSKGKSVLANRALVESNVKRATLVAVELSKLEASDRKKTAGARHMPATPVGKVVKESKPSRDSQKGSDASSACIDAPGKVDVLVAGSLALDLACDYTPIGGKTSKAPVAHTSNPARVSQSLGGVGYNVAIASHYMGASVLFCSAVADDVGGRAALDTMKSQGLDTAGIRVLSAASGARTGQYVAINDTQRELVVAMADMAVMESPEEELEFDGFWEPLVHRNKPQWLVVDANWSARVLIKWLAVAKKYGARVAFEPVSTAKASRLFGAADGGGKAATEQLKTVPDNAVSLAAPNKMELSAMYARARECGLFESESWWRIIDEMGLSASGSRDRLVAMTSASLVDEGVPQQSIQLLPFMPCIVAKLGADGVLLTQLLRPGDVRLTSPESAPYILSRTTKTTIMPTANAGDDSAVVSGGVYMRLFPAASVIGASEIVSVNGAGDTLLGVLIAGLLAGGREECSMPNIEDLVPIAQQASVKSLKSPGGVSRDIQSLRALLPGMTRR